MMTQPAPACGTASPKPSASPSTLQCLACLLTRRQRRRHRCDLSCWPAPVNLGFYTCRPPLPGCHTWFAGRRFLRARPRSPSGTIAVMISIRDRQGGASPSHARSPFAARRRRHHCQLSSNRLVRGSRVE
jgi:hypothetical protein